MSWLDDGLLQLDTRNVVLTFLHSFEGGNLPLVLALDIANNAAYRPAREFSLRLSKTAAKAEVSQFIAELGVVDPQKPDSDGGCFQLTTKDTLFDFAATQLEKYNSYMLNPGDLVVPDGEKSYSALNMCYVWNGCKLLKSELVDPCPLPVLFPMPTCNREQLDEKHVVEAVSQPTQRQVTFYPIHHWDHIRKHHAHVSRVILPIDSIRKQLRSKLRLLAQYSAQYHFHTRYVWRSEFLHHNQIYRIWFITDFYWNSESASERMVQLDSESVSERMVQLELSKASLSLHVQFETERDQPWFHELGRFDMVICLLRITNDTESEAQRVADSYL